MQQKELDSLRKGLLTLKSRLGYLEDVVLKIVMHLVEVRKDLNVGEKRPRKKK